MGARICHLTSVHNLTDTRIFYKECRTLADAGYEVFLIGQNDRDEWRDGVQILGLAKPKNRIDRMLNTTRQLYKKAVACNADIYHFHDPELIPVGLLLKAKGKKVIYDVHEDVPRQILSKSWIPSFLRNAISCIVERIENYGARRFDWIITATPHIRERFLKVSSRVTDINNFPILSELHLPNIDWNSKEKLVCYVGGITKVRGIYEMIQAIGNTNCKLLLAGSFASEDERELAKKTPGWDQVIELGHVNREGVSQVLARSIAGLVLFHPEPNHINALPNKIFEYMSAGIPVIASNFPLWEEIVEGNKCGLCVDPLNPAEIADAIQWIMENPERASEMGKNGRKAVEEKYNWESEVKKLLRILNELLSSSD